MDPVTEQMIKAIGQILTQGILGALVVVLGVAYYKKDRALYEQSEKFRGQVIDIQREVINAVNKMGDLMEFLEKRAEPPPETTGRRRPPT